MGYYRTSALVCVRELATLEVGIGNVTYWLQAEKVVTEAFSNLKNKVKLERDREKEGGREGRREYMRELSHTGLLSKIHS